MKDIGLLTSKLLRRNGTRTISGRTLYLGAVLFPNSAKSVMKNSTKIGIKTSPYLMFPKEDTSSYSLVSTVGQIMKFLEIHKIKNNRTDNIKLNSIIVGSYVLKIINSKGAIIVKVLDEYGVVCSIHNVTNVDVIKELRKLYGDIDN